MPKAKGGRGKRLPYSTTTIRIPEPLKAEVQKKVQEYEEGKGYSYLTGEVSYFTENGDALIDEITFPLPAGYQHFICVSYNNPYAG
jgi:hypothetical protein